MSHDAAPAEAARDAHWMHLALDEARAAAAAGEVPVGAVVVRDGRLVATGRNSPVAGHDPSAHAEVNALRAAAAALGNYRLDGCELFVTLEPCPMCAGAMLHARLRRVVYGARDPRTGAAGSVIDVFAAPALNHQTAVHGGVLADEGGALLQDFFRARRQEAQARAQPLRDDALRTPGGRFEHHEPPGLAPRVTPALAQSPALRGWRLVHAAQGPDSGADALLCLHGWGQWGYAFRALLAAHADAVAAVAAGTPSADPLAASLRVLVPDLIGFGRSDKPKREAAHSIDFHAAVLDAWLAEEGIDRLVVLHHPQAGSLAEALARARPGRVLARLALPARAADEAARAAWRAPFPDRGHEAALRAFGQRGPSREDLHADDAAQALRRAMGYFAP